MDLWQVWWVWMVAAGMLGMLEMLAPAFVFLGFAAGAALTGILIGAGLLGAGFGLTVAVFAVLSLGSWIALRALFGRRHGQVRIWDRDINEN